MSKLQKEPTTTTWTLRLKNRKTTVLLFVDPLETFASIKERLLDALKEAPLRDPDSKEVVELPSDASHLQLGRPTDAMDPRSSFQLGEWEFNTSDDDGDVKGKGKAPGKGRPKKSEGDLAVESSKQCPKGAGLKDNSVLAFKWAEEYDAGDEDDPMGEAQYWPVQIASYEDLYGEQNEGDVGGGK
ncbi:hypothetical protein BDV96DRAFT_352960 [Lophiotrema nucula]|uniref:Uncharacterized protein n=1 Tax=Lophiotrema nucula TaxID=690887 RepID=A0A6A5ZJJ9_9PLEO|nr:hypothetical protein BDV96DRAFT_352960 [Lophiotrema nucula]